MFVYLGSAARSLTEATGEGAQKGPAERIFFWAGLVIAIAVAVLVTRIARKALHEAVSEEDDTSEGSGGTTE